MLGRTAAGSGIVGLGTPFGAPGLVVGGAAAGGFAVSQVDNMRLLGAAYNNPQFSGEDGKFSVEELKSVADYFGIKYKTNNPDK